jgi:hypothetical protein
MMVGVFIPLRFVGYLNRLPNSESRIHNLTGQVLGPARLLAGEEFVHFIDAADTDVYRSGEFNHRAMVDLGGARTTLVVALLIDKAVRGFITLYRQEVRPFSDKQTALVQNFAAQAVIAIENAWLLSELRQSLEQQTATADVLRVISSSPGQLKSVFDAILENATRICEAKFGILNLYEDGGLWMGAMHNVPSAFADWHQSQRGAYQPIPGSPPDRVIRTKKPATFSTTPPNPLPAGQRHSVAHEPPFAFQC